MMTKVSVDTHILIWAFEGHASEGQEHKVELAKGFLQDLDEADVNLVLSSIVLGEFLIGIPEDRRPVFIDLASRYFQIVDHNARSAQCTAEVFQASKESGLLQELKDDPDIVRQEIMVDHHIIGSLMSHDVDILFCEDEPLRRVAGRLLSTQKMPAHQQDFFEEVQ